MAQTENLKYKTLRETLQRRIADSFAPGEKFLTQRAIMEEYSASFSTVDRALRELVEAGALIRSRGRGTFIRRADDAKPAGKLIALVLSRNVVCSAHAFYAEIMFQICDRLSAAGYSFSHLYIDECGGGRELVRKLSENNRFAGALLIGAISAEAAATIAQTGIPFVAVDNWLEQPGVCCVATDNESGAATVMEYLIEAGHRRIAFVSPPLHSSFLERFIGYCEALSTHGIRLDRNLIRRHLLINAPQSTIDELLALDPPVTAIFAANDSVGDIICRELCRRGIQIPGEISAAGFDDDFIRPDAPMPLTTFSVPRRTMGRRAVELLLAKLRGDAVESIRLTGALVERHSVFHLTKQKWEGCQRG